ncbi:hypothetical protein HAX54_041965 [Datura stramonium]|uniref:NB-ARC domain-containing protein n=1 Tax=Datura stramonium TaxID=4076 RepID=A0ABS8VY58_DATST|nr:hypothetical protein [Datura stramonium]
MLLISYGKQLYAGKRYLIVLDDLWDTATWDELTRPFPDVEKGSRIIFTTREKRVALHGKRNALILLSMTAKTRRKLELLEKGHLEKRFALMNCGCFEKEELCELEFEIFGSFIFKNEEEVMKGFSEYLKFNLWVESFWRAEGLVEQTEMVEESWDFSTERYWIKLDFLNELESLWFPLTFDALSTIARLPKLEELSLLYPMIQEEEWNMGRRHL